VDYLKIAEDAMRVFDNHYDYEIDLLNRNKVMPVLIAKSGKDKNAAFDEDDLAHMFFYLETSNSIPTDAPFRRSARSVSMTGASTPATTVATSFSMTPLRLMRSARPRHSTSSGKTAPPNQFLISKSETSQIPGDL
jgi:hypothetical protein